MALMQTATYELFRKTFFSGLLDFLKYTFLIINSFTFNLFPTD